MSSPDVDCEIYNKCQLVILNTMVHMSQQFIVADPIKVTKDSLIKSFALISESQCLVITYKRVILVSLIDDQNQKEIRLP